MGEFFQGWRRKIGVLTLMMACVFTNIWFITNHRCFELVSAIGEPIQILTARKGFFRWSSYMDINTTAAPFLWQSWPASENNIEPMDAPLMRIEWQWHLAWCGFEFGKGRCHGRSPMAVWAIPYWPVAVPLTLLSAYLLVSKPRKSTPKKVDEPTLAEGT